MTGLVLKGMTWSHPRGYDPMVACSHIWAERTGVTIEWDKRSLQDFESFPVDELARSYDLIVIDHPHVGQITEQGCLAPLDVADREDEQRDLALGSVGPSYSSYAWQGRQWAFPIDAATQVQAFRSDLISAPIRNWDEVMTLARAGRVLMPLRSPHNLMSLFSLCANLDHPCAQAHDDSLVDDEVGEKVIAMLGDLTRLIDPACLDMDPIAALEAMAAEDSRIACIPLAYGYVSYAQEGFRTRTLTFADVPATGTLGPAGTTLGGTGIAVSARSAHIAQAIDFAYWIASGAVQAGPYAEAGGQPGHSAAWEDDAVNASSGNFYRNTRATLEGAWVRPRHDGYMDFQQDASDLLDRALRGGEPPGPVVEALNTLYRASLEGCRRGSASAATGE